MNEARMNVIRVLASVESTPDALRIALTELIESIGRVEAYAREIGISLPGIEDEIYAAIEGDLSKYVHLVEPVTCARPKFLKDAQVPVEPGLDFNDFIAVIDPKKASPKARQYASLLYSDRRDRDACIVGFETGHQVAKALLAQIEAEKKA